MGKFIVSLTPVNHYSKLPYSQSVRSFIQSIGSFQTRCCFMAAQNLTDAYLIICFCFGKLNFLDSLEQHNKKISGETIEDLKKSSNKYQWDSLKSPLIIFKHNAEKFGRDYAQYCSDVLSKIQEKEALQYFKQVVNSELLYAVKVRILGQDSKSLYRQNEEIQAQLTSNKFYLILGKEQDGSYNVGIVEVMSNLSQSFHTVVGIEKEKEKDQDQDQEKEKEKSKTSNLQIQKQYDISKIPKHQKPANKMPKQQCLCKII